jgi:zinc transport system permease protein
LAHASGIAPRRENMLLTLALAISVAVAIKVVGALLIIALMLIPASAARPLARNPEGMAILASLIGVVSVALGLWGSFAYDTPTGPSIVCAAALFFALSALIGRVRMG